MIAFAVNNDGHILGLIVKQQPGDGDLRIIYRLGLFPLLVFLSELFSNLTAITVNAETDIVQEQFRLSFNAYTR